jgi:rare lipoprotein A
MRRVAGVFPLTFRLRRRRGPCNGKRSAKIHASTWSAALAVTLLCVGAALIVAGLLQEPEQSAGLRALPRTAHLPLQPNEVPNRDKKASREAVHAAPQQAELANATLPDIAPQDAPPPEALAPQGEPPGDDTIEENGSAQTGRASWYDLTTKTASGETMDATRLTAAHNTLPLGSHARVRNLDNGRAVVVRINDRGPFAKNRIIDLSKAAAEALDMIHDGEARVEVTPVAGEVASIDAGQAATR